MVEYTDIKEEYRERVLTTQELTHLCAAVCRIEYRDNGKLLGSGTGFHWGGGWVMTNSHVLQGTVSANPNADMSKLSFYFEKQNTTFTGQDRLAILVPVERNIPDLALIKLGMQTEYTGRPAPQEWEKDERKMLNDLCIPHLCNSLPHITAVINSTQVFTIHNGSGVDTVPYPQQIPLYPQQISLPGTVTDVEEMRFTHTSHTRPGSSGSPVFDLKTRKVLGVTWSDDEDDDEVNNAVNLCVTNAGSGSLPAPKLLEKMRVLIPAVEHLIPVQQLQRENANGKLTVPLNDMLAANELQLIGAEEGDSIYVFIPLMFYNE